MQSMRGYVPVWVGRRSVATLISHYWCCHAIKTGLNQGSLIFQHIFYFHLNTFVFLLIPTSLRGSRLSLDANTADTLMPCARYVCRLCGSVFFRAVSVPTTCSLLITPALWQWSKRWSGSGSFEIVKLRSTWEQWLPDHHTHTHTHHEGHVKVDGSLNPWQKGSQAFAASHFTLTFHTPWSGKWEAKKE